MRLRSLIVDDSEDDALLLVRVLTKFGFEVEFLRVDSAEAMRTSLSQQTWDVIISDYAMPHFSGFAALSLLQQSKIDIPFILVSGTIGEELAVQAMKAGAHDYLMKTNLQRLGGAIERELREIDVRKSRKEAENWLAYTARYDALTDLPNRNLLYEHIEKNLSSQTPFALMLMDLDHFKEINDTIGHHAGDSLLQQVGLRLQNMARQEETIARLGGDEFGILLPGLNAAAAVPAAERFLKAFEPSFTVGEIPLTVQTSIGITLFPEHGTDRDSLVRYADVAMYLAKESRSGYALYAAERDPYSTERLALLGDLHHAIDRCEMFMVYHPKVNLGTARVSGLESLTRWQHPKRGFIAPDQFITLAERSGFIKTLSVWGLEIVLAQAHTWSGREMGMPISFNLSARMLHDPNLPNQVAHLLETHAVKPEQLELEITESVIMADPAAALAILNDLSRMGITLSIDDFGTGYSSLSYLKRLPVNAVKIDKSFVMNMNSDTNDAQIVRSTIDLAHNLGLKVIAEGVETQEVWERLLALGCDEAQGYYMSRPLTAEDMTRWLSESPWAKQPSSILTKAPKNLQTSLEL